MQVETDTKAASVVAKSELGAEDAALPERNPRIRLLDSRWNEDKAIYEETPSDLPTKDKAPEPSLPYAFTWLRSFEGKTYKSTKALIASEALEKLINDTCRASSTINYKTFVPKFDTLIWDWDNLEEAAGKEDHFESDEIKQARSDLRLLLDQVKGSTEMAPYFEKREEWAKTQEIPFEHLWTLFPPGEVICAKLVFGLPQALIARSYTYDAVALPNGSTKKCFTLTCWSYDWNGDTFDRLAGCLRIEDYTGAKAISTLMFYPIKYHVDNKGQPAEQVLRTTLIERGKKFCQFCTAPKGKQLFYCDGLVIGGRHNFGAEETGGGSVGNFSEPLRLYSLLTLLPFRQTPTALLVPTSCIEPLTDGPRWVASSSMIRQKLNTFTGTWTSNH
jgi:hypothetical protein